MESQTDKQWAHKYLLDPLNAPEPSQEDGPGSHFTRKDTPPSNTYPTPPASASPTQSSFHPSNPFAGVAAHRQEAFASYADERSSRRKSSDRKSPEEQPQQRTGRRRGSSLKEKFPGDMSHQPLDILRNEAKAAYRSPHLKKKYIPGADTIDSLDRSFPGRPYHHEGPYDATLLARNINKKNSPVEAVRWSNIEALKATPRENLKDALDRHYPLQGTAVIPPGEMGSDGRQMEYEEGDDLNKDSDLPGGFSRDWEEAGYNPNAFMKGHRRVMSDGNSGYEMQTRSRPQPSRQRSQSLLHDGPRASGNDMPYAAFESDMRRRNTTGRKFSEGLKSKLGSLRRGKKNTTAEA
ncbi:MAG: hypothetical protein M1818_002084 [Claussenomyces sp. TS43310]|nr:MAG: hypothetical protein M1818_002084 [Claussenomyces sp. TS43310]